jgi:hypothetical protein
MPLVMSLWGSPSRVLAGMMLEAGGAGGLVWAEAAMLRIATEPIAAKANFDVLLDILYPFCFPGRPLV